MTETPKYEEAGQISIAIRSVLELLRIQTETPGAVELKNLPHFLLMAAEERHRQGDFGAERMLCDWADTLRDWPPGTCEQTERTPHDRS